MPVHARGETRRARRLRTLSLSLAAALVGIVLASAALLASDDDGLFELDGNPQNVAAAGDDWDALPGGSLANAFLREPASPDEDTTYFTGASNRDTADVPLWTYADTGALDDDAEITDAYGAMYAHGDGNRRLYFGLDRYDSKHDAEVGFWFFQNDVTASGGGFAGAHTVNDLLVLAKFDKNGAITLARAYKWVGGGTPLTLLVNLTGSAAAKCAAGGAADSLCVFASTGNVASPWTYHPKTGADGTLAKGSFVEGGLNVGLLVPGVTCMRSFLAETRTSQSPNAARSDFALGALAGCKAKVSLAPATATNPVGTNHELTITVSKDSGVGGFVAAAGVLVHGTRSGPGSFVGASDCTTNAVGQCMLTITSSAAGSATVRAYANVTFGATTVAVSTNGQDGSSSPAQKTWFVPNHPTRTETAPTRASVTLGDAVADRATVTWNASQPVPGGSVTFFLCAEGVSPCSAGGTQVGSPIAVDGNGNATSSPATPLAAGAYCFRAEYGGTTDSNGWHYRASSDSTIPDECFTVGKAASSIATRPENATVAFGGTNRDLASVGGLGGSLPAPTGNVTFFACGPNAGLCASGGAQVGGGVPVDAAGNATSGPFSPTATGEYCFRAEYEGDANYNASADSSRGECFLVTSGDGGTVTTPENASFALGGSNRDLAVVGGVGSPPSTPTGSVSFYLCGVDVVPCAAGGALVSVETLDGTGAATSASVTPLATGTYCFRGAYAGDGGHAPSNDSSVGECFDVGPAASETETTPRQRALAVGESNADRAHVSGLGAGFPVPTGSVSFFLCAVEVVPCESGGDLVGVETLDAGGNATSDPVEPHAAGTHCFRAEYEGDANYEASADNSTAECFEVTGPEVPFFPAPAGALVALLGGLGAALLAFRRKPGRRRGAAQRSGRGAP